MRKLLSTKAGATFNEETPNLTFAVRKEGIEIIYKVKAGVYMIATLFRVNQGRGMLFANWGTYFGRVTNPQVQIPQVEKCCPVLYSIMTGEDKDGITEMDFGHSKEDHTHGFGLEIDIPEGAPLIHCLDQKCADSACLLFDKMLKVYNELISKPPFPAWKTGLDEVWE